MARTKNQVTMGKRKAPKENEEEEQQKEEMSEAASRNEARVLKKQKKDELTKTLQELRQMGYEQLKNAGLEQPTTEGVGDCWLISILANHELEPQFIKKLTAGAGTQALTGSNVLRVVAHGLGGQAREAQAQE